MTQERTLTIADVMSAHPHTVGAEQTMAFASRLMTQHGVRHLPVLHGGALVGIVSDRDIAVIDALDGVDPEDVRIEEAMSGEPYVVHPSTSVLEVAKVMAEKKYGSAIVSERDTDVVGIFTTVDAMHLVARLLAKG